MEKIPKEHIDFLEHVIKRVYAKDENSEGRWDIGNFRKEYNELYNKEITLNEIRDVARLYKNLFFITGTNSDLNISQDVNLKKEFEKNKRIKKNINKIYSSSKEPTNKKYKTIIKYIIIYLIIPVIVILIANIISEKYF